MIEKSFVQLADAICGQEAFKASCPEYKEKITAFAKVAELNEYKEKHFFGCL